MSSTGVQADPITLQATGSYIPAYSVVKMDANSQISIATATTDQAVVGSVQKPVATNGHGAVYSFQGGGTLYATLNSVATAGDLLAVASGGRVSVGAGTLIVGRAKQNGEAGDVIEMIKDLRATV